jgi:hypothetical protein
MVVDPVKPIEQGLNMTWTFSPKTTTKSPEVFGPALWFSLHTGSAHLPTTLSPVSIKRIQGFINGIPEMVPCEQCSEHARAFIESNKDRIDRIKHGDEVFIFYVDFHNYVNKKLGKPLMGYEDAYKMYKTGQNVRILKIN